MTPTDGGANAPADTSINSLIDSAVDSVPLETAPESADAPAADDASEPTPEPEAAPVEPEPAAEAQPEPEAEPTEDEFADDDLSNPDRVSRDGKLHFYKPQRIAKFQEAYKTWREIESAVPGATVDGIKSNYEVAAAVEKMQADYNAGDVDAFTNFWREENPQAFAQMMLKAPDYLQANPQAYQALEQRFDQMMVDRLYRTAARNGDQTILGIAQHLDNVLNGRFRSKDDLAKRDPLAERQAEFARQQDKFRAETQQFRQQKIQAFMQETDAAVDGAVGALVNKALTRPELKVFEGKPQYLWMKRDLQDKLAEAERANPAWQKQYAALRRQAEAQPSESARAALVAMKEQFARQVIARALKATIEAATGTVLGQSAAAHARKAAAATRKEPAGAGSPVQGVSLNPNLDKAKSMDDVWKAIGW